MRSALAADRLSRGLGARVLPELNSLTRGRRGAAACLVLALAVYGVEAVAWPLHLGRDAGTYLVYWLDVGSHRPAFPELMLYRTPLAPLFWGPLLQYGGPVAGEVAAALAYAVSILAVGAAASALRRAWGVATVLLLLAWPDYGELFREVSSDSTFALVFALWLWLLVRVAQRPSSRGFAAVGAGVLLLVLARPAAQSLVVVALLPLVLPGRWKTRLARAAACGAAAALLLAGWAATNDLRYGDFTISRTVSAQLPLNRLFVNDRLVSPENGPESRKLAAAVRQHLLTQEPYRSYRITPHQFFSSGSFRMYSDLIPLSDRVWGWSSSYRVLQAVGIETVRAHPLEYAKDVLRDVLLELRMRSEIGAPERQPAAAPPDRTSETVAGRRLPKPTEGDLIPRSALWWLYSTPDGRIWQADTIAGPVRFRYAADARHAARLQRAEAALEAKLPEYSGSAHAARLLNAWSGVYPSMLVLAAIGAVAFALRRGRGLAIPAALLLLALVVVGATALSQQATAQYRLPFDPVFVLFAAAAVIGARPREAATAQPAATHA